MSRFTREKFRNIGNSRNLREKITYSGKWIETIEFEYEDEEKSVRKWEGLQRKRQESAVIIIAKLKPSNRYILVRQFRPPSKSYMLEFPAGLVDQGENIESAANRELLEETGFSGKIEKISPKLFSSPGIISETVSFVHISVDETDKKNMNPISKNEPGEFITVILKSTKEIKKFFTDEFNKGVFCDAKLYSYFLAQGVL